MISGIAMSDQQLNQYIQSKASRIEAGALFFNYKTPETQKK
jgi:hypothetical protein